MAQTSIHTFIASLEANISTIFPAAEVSFDGQNLSITFKRSDENGDFVHLLVDLTCMEEAESGSIAVHVRPDHIFVPHCIMEGSSRTLTLEDQTVFAGGEFDDLGEEFEDGHGNTMWMFQFPEERNTMSKLVCGLAKISSDHFFAQ
jgi:hypothetical protein